MAKIHAPVTIQVNSGLTTFINVFTIDPTHQQALLDLLKAQTDATMRKQPGFVMANFHRSLDGTSVVNYVQWTDQRSSDIIHENPEIMAGFVQYQRLNVKMDLRYYEVVFTAGQRVAVEPGNGLTTVISLLSTKSHQQQQVLMTLKKEVYPFVGQQAGFISIAFHRSLDGSRVLLYSQWNLPSTHQIPDLLRQREPLMSLLDGSSDRIETHLYNVAFIADADGLSIGDSPQVSQSQDLD
jgi:quinol monooxygenase YgiN